MTKERANLETAVDTWQPKNYTEAGSLPDKVSLMHAQPARLPSYRLHKPSGLAVVSIGGRDIYLGKHDTAESRQEYDRLIPEWLITGEPSATRLRQWVRHPRSTIMLNHH